MKYLVIDTESGSRHASSTLLTAYFLVVDSSFQMLGELYLILKPDGEDHYIVDAQGLAVNKINLVEHDKVAITCKQAKPLLYDFLKKHASQDRLTPVGHAVKGDIRRIIDNIISEGSWEQFCTYHYIDTSVVLQFLRACGKMPEHGDGSVGALGKYFGIINEEYPHSYSPPNGMAESELHDACFDTKVTMKIFEEFVRIGKNIPPVIFPSFGKL